MVAPGTCWAPSAPPQRLCPAAPSLGQSRGAIILMLSLPRSYPCRKLGPYHRAWILLGFLNQERALRRVQKSITSPGPSCYRCFCNQGKPWGWVSAGKDCVSTEREPACCCSWVTFRRAAEGAGWLALRLLLARKQVRVRVTGKMQQGRPACAVAGDVCWGGGWVPALRSQHLFDSRE